MALTLSILDQSPIVSGSTPSEAVAATIALAREADGLGYHRYWLAEHHAMGGLADASPEILLARLTAETTRIRLGTGGIMLPHYAGFKVAESFRMLDALAPGRIDLGVGRAPGGAGLVNAALESRDASLFPQQVLETIDFLRGATPPSSPFARLVAMPSGVTSPEVWMLGSSPYGASLAADLGLPYCFAHFIGGDAPDLTRGYLDTFRPRPGFERPRLMVALAVLVAPTEEEAEELTLPLSLWRMRLFRGLTGPIPSLEETRVYPWTATERSEVAQTRRIIAGTPSGVRDRLERFAAAYGTEELMIVTIAPDYAARSRSYRMLADVFAKSAVAA